MVSAVETSNPKHVKAMDSVVPKAEPPRDASISSSVSTPEPEADAVNPDVTQTQKRKGGRKPIYATSEERKQRNRQAQAAFRERRTEYIRQLETTIKHNEETLQSLQQSHRTAADECLMLRYKNSLLERILLEKGIDVQAELRMKSGAPSGPVVKPNTVPIKPPSTMNRPTITRNPSNRLSGGISTKPDHFGVTQHRETAYGIPSPQFQATPSSHASSPSHTKSPGGFAFPGAMSPVGIELQGQHGRAQLLSQPRSFSQVLNPLGTPQSETAESKTTHPGDQEYDAQADMVDDPDHEETVHQPGFVPGFAGPPILSGSQALSSRSMPNFGTRSGESSSGAYGNPNQMMGQFEPMLDNDPFGLTASMHFPTPFSYEQNNTRH